MSFYSSFKIMYYTFYALFLHRIGLILLKKVSSWESAALFVHFTNLILFKEVQQCTLC